MTGFMIVNPLIKTIILISFCLEVDCDANVLVSPTDQSQPIHLIRTREGVPEP